MKIRFGVIGCGQHAFAVHGPSYVKYQEEYTDVAFVSCCDISQEASGEFCKQFHFQHSYQDYIKMIEKEKLQAVAIFLPHAFVTEVALNVIKLGCHVLIEKPIGNNLEECKSLVNAVEHHQVIHQVAFNRRSIPLLTKMIQEIELNQDEVQYISCEMCRHNRSGLFHHVAIHGVDAISYLAKSPYQIVDFSYQNLEKSPKKTANIYMNGVMENGIRVRLEVFPCAGGNTERFRVRCKNKSYELYTHPPMSYSCDGSGTLVILEQNKKTELVQNIDEMFVCSGFYDETVHFFTCIHALKHTNHPFQSGIQGMVITEMIKNRQSVIRKEELDTLFKPI